MEADRVHRARRQAPSIGDVRADVIVEARDVRVDLRRIVRDLRGALDVVGELPERGHPDVAKQAAQERLLDVEAAEARDLLRPHRGRDRVPAELLRGRLARLADEGARLTRDEQRDLPRLAHAESRERLGQAHDRRPPAEDRAVREAEEVRGERRIPADDRREIAHVAVLAVAGVHHLARGLGQDGDVELAGGDACFEDLGEGCHLDDNGPCRAV